jgi:hypothetical protein
MPFEDPMIPQARVKTPFNFKKSTFHWKILSKEEAEQFSIGNDSRMFLKDHQRNWGREIEWWRRWQSACEQKIAFD